MAAEPARWVVHCDGSAVPNPGRMGLGAVLVGPDGSVGSPGTELEFAL